MTDLEWLDAVEQYATEFGHYHFCEADMKRLKPFMPLLVSVRSSYRASLAATLGITSAARQNMVNAVTKKLTQ